MLKSIPKGLGRPVVIGLAPGGYGRLDLSRFRFGDYVTIRSLGAGEVVFGSVTLRRSSHIRFDGIVVERPLLPGEPSWTKAVTIEGSDHIQILNSEIYGSVDGDFTNDGIGIFVRGSSDIVVEGNQFHDMLVGGGFFSVSNLTVRGNTLINMGQEGFNLAEISKGLIENNSGTLWHPKPGAHADFIQFWTTNTGGSSDIVIRGNSFLQQGDFDIQGIFINDENGVGHSNFTIVDNLIYTSSPHGITLTGAADSVIQNNTVLAVPGSVVAASGIAVNLNKNGFGSNLTVSDNVATSVGGTALTVTAQQNNLIAQWADPLGGNYYGDLFLDAFSGATVIDFLPVPGSVIDFGSGLGATGWMAGLDLPAVYIASETHDGTLQSLEPTFSAARFGASPFPPGANLSYGWDFGDGTTGTGETVTHKYAAAGEYEVKVTVSDGSMSHTADQTVSLESPYLVNLAFEGTLENVADADGTAAWNGTPSYVAGPDGLAADFDGAGPNSYVSVSGAAASISGVAELTISLDFRTESADGTARLLHLHTGYSVTQNGSQIAFQLTTEGPGSDPLLTYDDPALLDGGWHQLNVTYNAASGVATLYFDGQKVVEQSGFSGRVALVENRDLTIGGWQYGELDFHGQIDNVLIIQGELDPVGVSSAVSDFEMI